MNKICDILSNRGFFVTTTVGTSMYPLLRNASDQVIVKPANGRLKKYDVVLYRLDRGKYVLHRIVGFSNEKLIIRGDNLISDEYVNTDRIIGVMNGVWRNNKMHSANSLFCKIFAMLAVCKYKYRINKKK